LLWQAEKRNRPFIASVNVVNRCNLHCAGCYWTRTEREEDREELSIEAGVELIHKLWQKGIRHFFFIGGEPMTEREKKDFIAMSTRTIELLRPAEVARWSPTCPTFAAHSIRADGQMIERCIFGTQGDCSRCGCNVYAALVAIREGDREMARFML
jgi:hypothetical protein